MAIGFSGNSRMPESDAVIGLPDEATALEYDIPSYRPPEEADQQVRVSWKKVEGLEGSEGRRTNSKKKKGSLDVELR